MSHFYLTEFINLFLDSYFIIIIFCVDRVEKKHAKAERKEKLVWGDCQNDHTFSDVIANIFILY